MAKINEEILMEIKETAKDYMLAVKGHHLTENDIMIAENLIMFGYLKAINEKEKSDGFEE